ncbi:MAG: hypothetical protein WCD36_00395 [Rhodanobacteraceae bacterium]
MKILVVGRAKTGTTVISKTLASGAGIKNYYLEPKKIDFFVVSKHANETDTTVKIISDHWNTRPRLRNAIIHNELPMTFDRKVVIIRDFRDELLSRLFYFSFAWAQTENFNPNTAKSWVGLLQAKEQDPKGVPFSALADFLKTHTGYDAWSIPDLTGYVHFIRQLPKNAFLIRYEDFVAGNINELETYMGFKLPASRAVGNDLQRTLRSGTSGGWRSFVCAEDCAELERRYGDALEEFGYDNWDLVDGESIPPSICSEYAKRLVLEARPGSL